LFRPISLNVQFVGAYLKFILPCGLS
jgi:hypothetical protein